MMDACLEFFAHTATDQVLKGSPYSVVGKITCLSSSYLSPHPPAPPPCVFVTHSLNSGSPEEACCHLICSDIIWDLTGCVSCGL